VAVPEPEQAVQAVPGQAVPGQAAPAQVLPPALVLLRERPQAA
jgi:hypothetical protein